VRAVVFSFLQKMQKKKKETKRSWRISLFLQK